MKEFAYQETLLYGQHSRKPLSQFARQQAFEEKFRTPFSREARHRTALLCRPFANVFRRWKSEVSETEFGHLVEDILFLTSLGAIVAIFSFAIDIAVNRCHTGRLWLLSLFDFSVAAQFFSWVGFFVVFACFAVGITHIISPTAIGSGIPEVKTMIRGVVMKEYLTFSNLVAKVIGLTAALGSGLPVGKEGPFVHIAAASAAMLASGLPSFSSGKDNRERRMADILTPASAVGLSCTFAAPVGGLLYSIEGTSSFFAMKDYWRCFYASAVGTIAYRFLDIWFMNQETLTALERTFLPQQVPFDKTEVAAFVFLGMLCGLFGAAFIVLHKQIVVTIRSHLKIKAFLQKNRFIYPSLVAFAIGAVLFPPGIGRFFAGELVNPEALKELFSNFTWSTHSAQNIDEQHVLHNWYSPLHSIFLSTFLFALNRFWMCALSTTCPLPCGLIVPAFTIGAGLGRFCGEAMAVAFPDGINGNSIVPGGYALIGSAAFAGAVTHTFSPVIIIFELTGQIGHILPCLMAVMIANFVSRFLTPSVYECIIQLKKLPYLPSHIDAEALKAHDVFAESVMTKELQCLTMNSAYGEAFCLLRDHPFKSFPIVDSRETMMFRGSIERRDLKTMVEDQLSIENKLEYFSQRLRERKQSMASYLSSTTNYATIQEEDHDIDSSSKQAQVRKVSSGKRFSVTRLGDEPMRRMSTASSTGGGGGGPGQESGGDGGGGGGGWDGGDPRRKTSTASGVSVHRMIMAAHFPETISETPGQGYSKNYLDLEASTTRGTDDDSANNNRVRFKMSTTIDLHDPEKQQEWENYALTQKIDFRKCRYDPAPFQIVVKTTLFQIHHLFSLLSLHHAFVTDRGHLVGIISISEVREAVQCTVNSFTFEGFKEKMRKLFCCSSEGNKTEEKPMLRQEQAQGDEKPKADNANTAH